MKVIDVVVNGDVREFKIVEIADPVVSPGHLLIKVSASGVNRADLLQFAGKYPPPPGESTVLGLEVAGVVEAVSDAASPFVVGERVCALLAGGGYAEKVLVPYGQVMRLPQRYSMVEGAAIPEAFVTAYTNLFVEGGLVSGERVLIHGGSSGVGTAAIQLAKSAGASVACTVGSDSKSSACHALGAELVVNYRTEDFSVKVREWCKDGVDVILDIVGKEYSERNVELLARRGRLVCIATMSGAECVINMRALMQKCARVIGSVLRSRSRAEKAQLMTGFLSRFEGALEKGDIKPIVDSVYPFDSASDAHARMRSSQHVGKIILSLQK
jgi:NADPH2:quinone reductase